MDNQNTSPQSADVPPTPVTPSNAHDSGGKVLQPTKTILDEIASQPPPAPTPPQQAIPPQPQPQSPTAAPPMSQQPTAATPQQPTNTNAQDDYDPSQQKVCDRATSLKLYAIVMFILDGLALAALISLAHAVTRTESTALTSSSNLIKYVTIIFPIVADVAFLISKSVTLVKAFLIVILINYAIGLVGFVLDLLAIHNISFSVADITTVIIPIIFLFWTMSVYSEVSLLSE
jgi:hypothetical protein